MHLWYSKGKGVYEMIINGTIRHIRIERTRSLEVRGRKLKCPDYRLEGEFSPYNRLADFLWDIFSKFVVPQTLKTERSKGIQDYLLPSNVMGPASLTIISDNEKETHYLLTCMDKKLTTTYHVRFALDQEIFRNSHYGFVMNDLTAKVTKQGIQRTFEMTDVTEQGYNAYWELSQALWLIVEDSISVKFSGTEEEEEDSLYYFAPKKISGMDIIVHLEKRGSRYILTGELPNGSYYAEAIFNIQEMLN